MEETPLWVETMGPLLMAVGAVVELPCELGQSLTLDHVAPISKSACSCRCLTGLAQVENCRLILEPGLNQRVRETRHRCGRLRDLGVRIMQPFARAPHLHLPVVHPPSIPKFAHPTPAHAGLRGSSQLSSWRPPPGRTVVREDSGVLAVASVKGLFVKVTPAGGKFQRCAPD